MPLIAPSMLSANFLRLGEDIDMVNHSQADWFHLDVMDGRFVPNITFGMPVIVQMKKQAQKPFDVHLMIEQPERYIDDFAKAGADVLSIHYEASTHLHRSLQAIRNAGMKAGVAINPHTPASVIEDVLDLTDLVLVMSVNPGFGGQRFIPRALEKIRILKQMIIRYNSSALIEIDGGVTLDNAAEIIAAGTDVLVAGNTVFSSDDPAGMIAKLKAA